MQALAAPMLPSELERDYRILNPLGRHDRIETYLAVRREDGAECVVRYERGGELTPRERRNLEESWVLLRRIRHEAFPEILRIGMPVSGGCYLVHRFMRGANLRNLKRHLDADMVRAILIQLIPALHLLHHHGLTHQRISPEKIIVEGLGRDCRVRLVDPPLSRADNGRRWAAPACRSPEAEGSGRLDGRADLYSLAVAISEAMVGRHPFPPLTREGAVYAARCRDLPPLGLPEDLLPTPLEDVLLRMGSTDPIERPANMLALYRDLRRRKQAGIGAVHADFDGLLSSTRAMAFEPRVREVIAVLPRDFRPVEIEAAPGLDLVGDELGARLRLRRSRRLLRLRKDGTSERVSPAEGVPETLVLTVAEGRETVSLGTAEGVIRVAVRRLCVDDLRRRLYGLCLGPLDRRRSKLLAQWLAWRFGDDIEAVDGFLKANLLSADDHVLLDWIKIGKAILDSLAGLPRRRFRNPASSFPTGIPLLDAKLLKRYCLTSEAAQWMARLFEETPERPGARLTRARQAVVVANHLEHAGRFQTAEQWRVRAARELADSHPGLMERILLVAARNTRTPRAEMAEKYGLPIAAGFDPDNPGPDLPLHFARVLKLARELIFTGDTPRAESLLSQSLSLVTSIEGGFGCRKRSEPCAASDEPVRARRLAQSRITLYTARQWWNRLILESACAAYHSRRFTTTAERLQPVVLRHTRRLLVAAIEPCRLTAGAFVMGGLWQEARCWMRRVAVCSLRNGIVQEAIANCMTMASFRHAVDQTDQAAEGIAEVLREERLLIRQGESPLDHLNRLSTLYAIRHDNRASVAALKALSKSARWCRASVTSRQRTTAALIRLLCVNGEYGAALARIRSEVIGNEHQFHSGITDTLATYVHEVGVVLDDRECIESAVHLIRLHQVARKDTICGIRFHAITTGEKIDPEAIMPLGVPRATEKSESQEGNGLKLDCADSEVDLSRCLRCEDGDKLSRDFFMINSQVLWVPIGEKPQVLLEGLETVLSLKRKGRCACAARLAVLCAARCMAQGWTQESVPFLALQDRLRRTLSKRNLRPEQMVSLERYCLCGLGEDVRRGARWLSERCNEMGMGIKAALLQAWNEPTGSQALSLLGPRFQEEALDALIMARRLEAILVCIRRKREQQVVVLREQPGMRSIESSILRIESGEVLTGAGSTGGGLRFQLDELNMCILGRSKRGNVVVLGTTRTGISSLGDSLERRLRSLANDIENGIMREEGKPRASDTRGDPVPKSACQTLLVGSSPAFTSIVDKVSKLSRAGVNVLLEGESGTGKERLAQLAHRQRWGCDRPLVAVDCPALCKSLGEAELFGYVRGAFSGAISAHRGLLSQASGGTLFLDEVGDLSREMQAKVLRCLSSGEVRPIGKNSAEKTDFFIVSATNRCLPKMIEDGLFRLDLFHRLGSRVLVPALRHRKSDIGLLWDFFVRELRPTAKYEEDIVSILADRDWPGNVRELRNLAATVLALEEGDEIRAETLQRYLRENGSGVSFGTGCGASPPEARCDIGFQHAVRRGRITRREFSRILHVSSRTATRDLQSLVERGLVRMVGKGRSAAYYPVNLGDSRDLLGRQEA